jgi:hypothetical protein
VHELWRNLIQHVKNRSATAAAQLFLAWLQRKVKYSLWNSQSKMLVETIVAEKMSYLCLAGYTYEFSFPTH